MRKRNRGQSLELHAGDWNRLCDMARQGIGQGPGVGASSNALGLIWLWVKNTSGADRSRFDCMSLGSLVFDVETNVRQDVIFEALTADPTKTPIVLQEPIAAGRIGRAAISGVTLAKVATSAHVGLLYAGANASGHDLLPGAGPIKLLSAPSTSATTLRPVNLGPFYPLFPVKTKAACAAAGSGCGMSSVSCDLLIAAVGGSKSDSGLDVTVFNPGGPIASGACADAQLNGVGELEFVVVKCN
jgi:hypothetical protein